MKSKKQNVFKMDFATSLKENIFQLDINDEYSKIANDFADIQMSQFWTQKDLKLIEDISETNFTPELVEFLFRVTLFFRSGDNLIIDQILKLFGGETDHGIKKFVNAQSLIETIHAESYNIAITKFLPEKEIQRMDSLLASGDLTNPVIKKYKYVYDNISNEGLHPGIRIAAAAVSEGIFFCSTFALIFFLKKKDLLRGFVAMNELIRKDEMLHRNFNIHMLRKNLSEDMVDDIAAKIKEAVEIDIEAARYCMEVYNDPNFLIEDMISYIKHLANQIFMLTSPLFNDHHYTEVKPDFKLWWIDEITQKNNFFENKAHAVYKLTSLKDEGTLAYNIEDLDSGFDE